MNHQVIRIITLLFFAAGLLTGPKAAALSLLGPSALRLLTRTAIETAAGLVVTETYDQLKKLIAGQTTTNYGISDFSIELLSHTDSVTKRVQSIRTVDTRSIIPNPITGTLSYYHVLKVGYTNAGMPVNTTVSTDPFTFLVRNLSESCADPDRGTEYRRTIDTKLLARHQYTRTPTSMPPGYYVSVGFGHGQVPSEAPCETGITGPPAGTSNLRFTLTPNGGTVLSLPAEIHPNAVSSLWLTASYLLPTL